MSSPSQSLPRKLIIVCAGAWVKDGGALRDGVVTFAKAVQELGIHASTHSMCVRVEPLCRLRLLAHK
jgi:hypothetical protein